MKAVEVTKMKMKPKANFDLGKKKPPKLTTGDDVTVVVKGRVTSFSESEWGNTFGIDIRSLDVGTRKDSGMSGDIRKMRASRRL